MKAVEAPAPVVTAIGANPGSGAVTGAKVAQEKQEVAAVEKLTQPSPQEMDMNTAARVAAKQIDSYLKSIGREVEFRVDEGSGRTVVTVRETATGDVIRQIPNEEVLQLARRFAAGSGSLLDLKV